MATAIQEREAALSAWRTPYAETPNDLWTRTNVGEVFPRALTPLTYSVVDLLGQRLFAVDPRRAGAIPPDLIKNGVLPAIFRVINGRMFYNAGLIHHLFTDRFGMPSWFWMMGLGGPQDPAGTYFAKQPFRPLRMVRGLPYILRETHRQRRTIAAFYRDGARMEAQALTLQRERLDDLDTEGLLRRLEQVIGRAQPAQAQLLDGSAAAVSAFGMLAGLCGRWLGNPGVANDLVTGSGDMQTANATLALWRIARRARGIDAARAVFVDTPPAQVGSRLSRTAGARTVATTFADFLRDFGHRCVDEFELATPRWSEQPDLPVATIRTYMAASDERDPHRALSRQRRQRQMATRAARARLTRGAHGIFPYRWLVLRTAMRQAQALLPLRENPKHVFLRYMAEVRRTVLALAERLQAAGAIDDKTDVFFLTRDELRALTEAATRGESPSAVRSLVVERRRLHACFEGWSPPEAIRAVEVKAVEAAVLAAADASLSAIPDRHGQTPVGIKQESNNQENKIPSRATGAVTRGTLMGIAASSGIATGRARVALTPDGGVEIEPGEILIAPFTDPGWTPLFAVAGGIVMDLGGLLSHGAIVAREYGIPAVVNTRSATTDIRMGQRVTVNGNSGTVTWEGAPTDGQGE